MPIIIASFVSCTIDQLDILHIHRRPRCVKSDPIYFLNIFFQKNAPPELAFCIVADGTENFKDQIKLNKMQIFAHFLYFVDGRV